MAMHTQGYEIRSHTAEYQVLITLEHAETAAANLLKQPTHAEMETQYGHTTIFPFLSLTFPWFQTLMMMVSESLFSLLSATFR